MNIVEQNNKNIFIIEWLLEDVMYNYDSDFEKDNDSIIRWIHPVEYSLNHRHNNHDCIHDRRGQ